MGEQGERWVMPKAGNLGGLIMEHFDASSLEAFVPVLALTV